MIQALQDKALIALPISNKPGESAQENWKPKRVIILGRLVEGKKNLIGTKCH